jgi:hypothetical protein
MSSFDNLQGVELIAQECIYSHIQYVGDGGQGSGLSWGDDHVADAAGFLTHIEKATEPSDKFEIVDDGDTIELTVKNDSDKISKAFRFSLVPDEKREELLNALRSLQGTGEILRISY